MEILITYLTRRAKGGVSRRSEERSVEAVHFGRSTNAEVYLADPRIRYEHAVIHQRQGGMFVEVEKLSDVRVNGQPARTRPVVAGDVLGIG
ncbi:MAG: FHA domain-containing protein, partial [Alphaproteobacteria bacterium]